MSKLTKVAKKGVFTMILTEQPFFKLESMPLNKKLDGSKRCDSQNLLEQFAMIFEPPTELPPRRGHDHQILRKDVSQVVKMRPYRYPTIQKNEIEKTVAEMKETGIIRDSCNSFASPVVLVKKRMPRGRCVWIIGN